MMASDILLIINIAVQLRCRAPDLYSEAALWILEASASIDSGSKSSSRRTERCWIKLLWRHCFKFVV